MRRAPLRWRASLWRKFNAALTDIEYVTCLDNIFIYNGKPKHEMIQLFRARFVNESFYQLTKTFPLVEGDRTTEAFWLETQQILTGKCRLVPESCLQYLSK